MRTFTLLLVFLSSTLLFAGDKAIYRTIGFSPSGQYFMFAEYGINSNTNPYSNTYIVNIPSNTFVKNGVIEKTYPIKSSLGDDGLQAVFKSIEDTASLRKTYGINVLDQGRPIYFRIMKEEAEDTMSLVDLTDYATGLQYKANVIQTINPTNSKYYIDLKVYNQDGSIKYSKQVGTPNYLRNNVVNYRIIQMILSPNEKSLIFVVEKQIKINNDVNIRYMVETLSI